MTAPPTDRARALIKQCLVCDRCNGPWPCQCGGLGTVALERAENAIAQLLRDTEAEVRERMAKVAENVRGGYTANIRIDASEPELVRDKDGPWVLNSDVAAAIREAKP